MNEDGAEIISGLLSCCRQLVKVVDPCPLVERTRLRIRAAERYVCADSIGVGKITRERDALREENARLRDGLSVIMEHTRELSPAVYELALKTSRGK